MYFKEQTDDLLISLIIASVDRVDELRACLLSLCASSSQTFEVIVVDQNEDMRLAGVIEMAERYLPLQWIRQGHRSAADARNLGAMHAKGQWLGFPDDDCLFLPETMGLLNAHIRCGDVDAVAGMTRDRDGRPSVLPWYTSEQTITRRTLRRTVVESTFYVRRDCFLSVGGFDPAFGPGSIFAAEEVVDFIRRLQKALPEVRMKFCPDIHFVHNDNLPLSDGSDLKKIHSYAYARGACFARHWRSASPQRLVNDVGRHVAGTILSRGLHRQRRIVSLAGYVKGFLAYRDWERTRRCGIST